MKEFTFDDYTELMQKRITKALEKDNLGCWCTWDIAWGDCPLGWDVCIYIKASEISVYMVKKICECVAKAMSYHLDFTNDVELQIIDDGTLRASFCADLIPYQGE